MASNGNYGRFSERLKKIAFRKRNRVNYDEDKNVKTKYNNILKVLAAIPGMVYTNLSSDSVASKVKKEEKKVEGNVVITTTLVGKDSNNLNVSNEKNEDKVVSVYKNSRKEDLEQEKILLNEIKDVNKSIGEVNLSDDISLEKEIMVESTINDKNGLEKENIVSEPLLKDTNIIAIDGIIKENHALISDKDLSSNLDNQNFLNKDNTEDEKQILGNGNISKGIKEKDNEDEILEKEVTSFLNNDDKKMEDITLLDERKDDNANYLGDFSEYHGKSVGISPISDLDSYSKNVSDSKEIIKNIGNSEEKKLAKDILNSIKKKLVSSINNLEILQSELYILSEVNGDNKTVEECNRQMKEIKELLKKIEKLKKKYDYLKDNYDFEYLMDLDDDNLVQKITELRDNYGKKDAKDLVEEYKLLDEYKFLYSKVGKIENKTREIENNKNKELEELKKRDIDFEKLKSKLYNVSNVNSSYNQFIKDQNQIVKELNESVSKINSYEKVTYHFDGFNKLLLNSFKYLGLLMLKPFRGSVPAIATETLITYGVVKNLYKNLSLKEDRRIVYEAIDYENTINNIIGNMDLTSNLIDNSLRTIAKLKLEYADKFSKYENDFPEYEEIVHKINDIENKIMDNKIKVEIIKKQALEQKKENNKKLILVDKLNNSDKNN